MPSNSVRLFHLLAIISCCAYSALAQYPQPHTGWKLVAGGEDLIAKGYWGTVFQQLNAALSVSAPVDSSIAVTAGVMNATAGSKYFGSSDPVGPWLRTSGDFGVIATIQTGPGIDGLIGLTGSLATGGLFWQGHTMIEFGVNSAGDYSVDYWDGSASSPVFYRTLKAGAGTPQAGQVTIELLRQNGQFLLFFDGVEYGPIPDPGLFSTHYILPGFTLAPGQQLNVTQFAFEVPQSDSTAQLMEPVGLLPAVHSGDSLGSLAEAAGKVFSVQVSAEQLSLGRFQPIDPGSTPDPTVGPKILGEFNAIVATEMYFFLTEPAQARFYFDTGDALMATAKATGRPVHCHHLIGGDNSYTPYWVTHGSFTKAQLTQIMQNHIQAVVSHYQGQCASWDVVNEALAADGTLRTDNIWAQVIGPEYIDIAFQTARQFDSRVKLYYNEYLNENATPKASGVYKLVASMKQRGIPIDGVGMQAHWDPESADYTPNHDQIVANMTRLATLGLSVRISELDVRLKLPASAAQLATQANFFATTVQACLDSPNCVEIAAFGSDDAISWVPKFFPGYGAATMFDGSFASKPAYASVAHLLRAAPKAPSTITRVNTSSGGEDIAQNTFIEIKGANLVPATTLASGVLWNNAPDFASGRMPTQLNGVSVTINGNPAFVYFYCSAVTSPVCTKDQIDVLTPLDHTTGPVKVIVTSGSTSTPAFTVNMNPVAPTFLLFNPLGPVVATHADYTLVGAINLYSGYTTPARPGEVVVLYGIGFGLPVTPLTNGSSTQSGQLPSVPTCKVGDSPAGVYAALISPGLYQLNLTIPSSLGSGDYAVSCSYGGATTPTGATITVRQN